MQQKFQGNLSAASFPFASTMKGPSIVIPGRDQSSGPYRDFSGNTTQLGMNLPQMYYAENIIPTNEGYKSIAYNPYLPPASGYTGNFIDEYTVFDGQGNKAILAITDTFQIWIFSGFTSGAWVALPPSAGTWTAGILTIGVVAGTIYVNLQGLGVYSLDISATTLTKETVVGATDSTFIGILDSTSYLIAYDEISTIWSSTLDPLDFTPSLITGAGGGNVEGLKGQIVFCKEINNGWIIYSSVMIFAVLYQGNLQYPWVFKPLPNGAGISSRDNVADDMDLGSHIAWTSSGILEITVQYCTPKYPELTDFLAAGIWEEYNSESGLVETSYFSAPMNVRLASVASRYLCFSYGQPGFTPNICKYALIYDSLLKRWGKLKIDHVVLFEIVSDTTADAVTWAGTAPNEWIDYPVSWSSLVEFSNVTPKAKNTLGVFHNSAAIAYVDFKYGTPGTSAVVILGKFQLTRTSLCTLEQIDIEGVLPAAENFSVKVQRTLDGKTEILPVTLPSSYAIAENRRLNCRITGTNHSLIFSGGFELYSYILTMHQNGRR